MNFLEIAQARQSCRAYDPAREVEQEKLDTILEAVRLAPSACTASPITSPSAAATRLRRWPKPPWGWG